LRWAIAIMSLVICIRISRGDEGSEFQAVICLGKTEQSDSILHHSIFLVHYSIFAFLPGLVKPLENHRQKLRES
jgi:hypothetical protein